MEDWLSYTLSDFLLFSPRTYYRLIERHNIAVWPAHLIAMGAGFVVLALVRRDAAGPSRAVSIVLALAAVSAGYGFVWRRYAAINWFAAYLAILFAVVGVGLLWRGIAGHARFRFEGRSAELGGSLFVLVLAFYPVVARLAGREWSSAEVFGIAPDPTMLGIAAIALASAGRRRWDLLLPPIVWCGVSAATLRAMTSPDWWIPLAGSSVIVGAVLADASVRARRGVVPDSR